MVDKKKVYFDVCGTLFNKNTTFDFVCFYHLYNKNYLKFVAAKLVSSVIGKVINRLTGVSLRKILLFTLKYEKKSYLYEVGGIYVDKLISFNKNIQVFNYFLNYVSNQNEYQVILVSASIDPVIVPLCQKFQVAGHSSKLNYKLDRVNVGLCFDLKGKKYDILSNNKNNDIFFSDNIEDLECSQLVNTYYRVIKKKGSLTKRSVISSVGCNVRDIYV